MVVILVMIMIRGDGGSDDDGGGYDDDDGDGDGDGDGDDDDDGGGGNDGDGGDDQHSDDQLPSSILTCLQGRVWNLEQKRFRWLVCATLATALHCSSCFEMRRSAA